MIFWFATVGLLLLGSLFVVVPLLYSREDGDRGDDRDDKNRTEANVKLYRERFVELREELAAGNLDGAVFESLVAELQRSLLRDVGVQKKWGIPLSGSSNDSAALEEQSTHNEKILSGLPGTSKLVPVLSLLLIPILAHGLYDKWGYYDDIQLSDLYRQAIHPSENQEELKDLVANLKDGVSRYPDNQWAWYFLGRSYSRLGMYNEAKNAYQEAILYLDTEPDKIMAMSQFVLASFLGAERVLTQDATAMADRVLEVSPNDQTVLRILATAAREKEDLETAIVYWQRLARVNPASSSARVYRSNIAAAQNILQGNESAEKGKADVAGSPQIKVKVTLAENLDLMPGLRVFVAAHDAARRGTPPLAVAQLTVAELPTTVLLDNNSSVGPFNLSSADSVFVSALVSQQGAANPQPGDFRALTKSFNRSEDIVEVDLLIAEQVL